MTTTDDHGRPDPPMSGDEVATLVGFLEYQRATLGWKTAGLDADALRARLGPSSVTLGGMLKHLAFVEDVWFSYRLAGQALFAPWDTVDWTADEDWDWNSAADDSPEELRALWRASVERSRAAVADALATGDLAQVARKPLRDGRTPSLRWILCHLIEEYARHNGHADLIRESIDGSVGE